MIDFPGYVRHHRDRRQAVARLCTDLIAAEVGASVTFDRVILASKEGGQLSIGTPLVSGASVTGTVLRQAKDKKILVFKYKPKKRVRKLNGHRQRFAEVRIERITL